MHAVVSGRVQGVGFRYSAVREARRLGLTGCVRNLPDGAVEVIAEGPRGRLARLEAWLRLGPPGARVLSVDVNYFRATGTYRDFEVDF
jgi:acylphosphatase